MKEYFYFLLEFLHTHQHLLALGYLCFGILVWKYSKTCRMIFLSVSFLRLASALGVIVIVTYLLLLISYVNYPNYFDHVEPTIASISWLGMHGAPLYPDWTTDYVYGLLYGPVLYFVNGLVLFFQPTLMASKIPGVLTLIAALVLISIISKQRTGSNVLIIFFLVSLISIFVPFGVFVYWNRAEPFLIFISALALLAALQLRPLTAAASIGALAGLAAGFKLHGFIYVVPSAMAAFGGAESRRDRFFVVVIGTACAIFFAFLPFIWNAASITGYLSYLNLATSHGLMYSEIQRNILFALFIMMPIFGIWALHRPSLDPPDSWLLAGLFSSIAATVLIAAKPGAGSHHLLPFVPLCLYGMIVVMGERTDRILQIVPIFFICLLFAYGPGLFNKNVRHARYFYLESNNERKKIDELQKYLNSYPDAQIGLSDDRHYSDTFYRVISVFQGRAPRIDFASWMDLEYGGVSEKNILRFINRCEVPAWILPLGTPFTKTTWYTNAPMFSDNFRRTFLMNYKLIEQGHTYQVWSCRLPTEIKEQN